jgi:hypothetical protein
MKRAKLSFAQPGSITPVASAALESFALPVEFHLPDHSTA